MDSPYAVLGIDRDADVDAIERAYRRRVKEAHPDLGGSAAAFRRVQAAYETVTAESGSDERGVSAERIRRAAKRVDTETQSAGNPETRSEPEPTYDVEYLNYDAVIDRGWDLAEEELFSRARDADLDTRDYGHVSVQPEESLLEAAERAGFAWPFACRGGACANCAVAVLSGDMGLPVDHVLSEELTDRGIRLSCVGAPITADTQVVYNVKHMPALEELRLPPTPFERAQAGD